MKIPTTAQFFVTFLCISLSTSAWALSLPQNDVQNSLTKIGAFISPQFSKEILKPTLRHSVFFKNPLGVVVFEPNADTLLLRDTAISERSSPKFVFDLNKENLVPMEPHLGDTVLGIEYSRDGQFYALAYRSEKLKENISIFETTSKRMLFTLTGIGRNCFSADGLQFAIISKSNKAEIYNVKSGQMIDSLGVSNDVQKIQFSDDGSYFLTHSLPGILEVYDLKTHKKIIKVKTAFLGYGYPFYDLVGKYLAVSDAEDHLLVYDIQTAKIVKQIDHLDCLKLSFALSSDGPVIAYGIKYGSLQVYNLSSGQIVRVFDPTEVDSRAFALSLNGKYLASRNESGKAMIYDLESGEPYPVDSDVNSVFYPLEQLIFSRDGRHLMILESVINNVRVYDL